MPLYGIDETDKAYLAGIVDGEGCITVAQRAPCSQNRETRSMYVSRIRVQMCDETLIRWMQSITGLGKVYAYKPRNLRHSEAWSWHLGVGDGCKFLEAIYPYLRLKKKQAELFIELAKIRSASRSFFQNQPERQQAISDEFRVLNRRGAA